MSVVLRLELFESAFRWIRKQPGFDLDKICHFDCNFCSIFIFTSYSTTPENLLFTADQISNFEICYHISVSLMDECYSLFDWCLYGEEYFWFPEVDSQLLGVPMSWHHFLDDILSAIIHPASKYLVSHFYIYHIYFGAH